MTEGLIAAALLMGAAGVPHCAVMCAAPCTAAARACAGSPLTWQAGATLQAGRLLGYAVLGAAAATSAGFGRFLSEHMTALRPLWQMLQLAVLVFGLWLLVSGHAPAWILNVREGAGRLAFTRGRDASRQASERVSAARASLRLLGAGLTWAAVPCVQLYAAVVLAALGSSAAEGAALMVLFGLPAALTLAAGPGVWAFLRGRGLASTAPAAMPVAMPGQLARAPSATSSSASTWPVRAAGAALVMSAGAWLALSWAPVIQAWCA